MKGESQVGHKDDPESAPSESARPVLYTRVVVETLRTKTNPSVELKLVYYRPYVQE